MRLLIIEDNAYVAAMMIRAVIEAGHTVVVHQRSVEESFAAVAEYDCDAAVVDSDLLGPYTENMMQLLATRGIRCLLLSARPGQLPSATKKARVVSKPIRLDSLRAALGLMEEQVNKSRLQSGSKNTTSTLKQAAFANQTPHYR